MSYDLKRDLLAVEMADFGIAVPHTFDALVSYEYDGEYDTVLLAGEADWSSSWTHFDLMQAEVALPDGIFYLSWINGAGVVSTKFFNYGEDKGE